MPPPALVIGMAAAIHTGDKILSRLLPRLAWEWLLPPYFMGKAFQGQWPPPQVGQERGGYGLVVKGQFRLGKAVLGKHHLRQMGES